MVTAIRANNENAGTYTSCINRVLSSIVVRLVLLLSVVSLVVIFEHVGNILYFPSSIDLCGDGGGFGDTSRSAYRLLKYYRL